MTDSHARIEQLNALAPGFIKLLGGSIIELDMDSQLRIHSEPGRKLLSERPREAARAS